MNTRRSCGKNNITNRKYLIYTAKRSHNNIYIYKNSIVLYCIMRLYTEGRLDRYHNRHSSGESEIRTQPWLSEGSLTCDPYHHRGPIF